MLDVSNIRIGLAHLDGSEQSELHELHRAVIKKLHLTPDDLLSLEPRKRSIDARKKHDIQLSYTVRIALKGGSNAERALLSRLERRHTTRDVHLANKEEQRFPAPILCHSFERPIVVGAGCAGLFCALSLAEAGLKPLLIERGHDAKQRSRDIEHFNATGELNVESNIQFGLGGAGTFSDGKLSTGTKSPAHRLILKTLVEAGAQRAILWDAKPHVGSDVLPNVVSNICERIVTLGGEVRFGCRLIDIDTTGGCVHSIRTLTQRTDSPLVVEEQHKTSQLILACGHSARDVFELLCHRGVALERKTFAMGARIEHPQSLIDRVQFGSHAGHPALGAASYKLVSHLKQGRSAFSFCMCPGGYVVCASSEREGVVTNGMSYSDRAGTNANAGLLANVFPEDLPGDDVLAGVELQRACERKAFELGGSSFRAPAQLVGDFLQDVPSTEQGSIAPTYPRGVNWGNVASCLPSYISDTLRGAITRLDQQLKGFAMADAVLTGVETRSSSPVRVVRTQDLQSPSATGLWPCGEGAGYAGGIMSAATDGIRIAEAVVEQYRH